MWFLKEGRNKARILAIDEQHFPTIPKGVRKFQGLALLFQMSSWIITCVREQRVFWAPAIRYHSSFSPSQLSRSVSSVTMDRLFAVWCLYEYQSPRSTPTVRRKQRTLAPKLKLPKPESQKQLKFRLLAKDDIEIVRQIYEEGHKDRIIPAFKIGILRSLSLLTMIILFAVLFAITRSFFLCVAANLLYSGAVLVCFYKLFNDHISRSLKSDLADISQHYKTQESCKNVSDFTDNGSSIWVAVKDNIVMGFLSFAHISEDTIELKRMGVLRKYWRNKVGKSLCQFAIEFIQATKYKRIILETTEAHRPAVGLYKKFQFELIKRQKRRIGLASIYIEHYELQITRAVSTRTELTKSDNSNIVANSWLTMFSELLDRIYIRTLFMYILIV